MVDLKKDWMKRQLRGERRRRKRVMDQCWLGLCVSQPVEYSGGHVDAVGEDEANTSKVRGKEHCRPKEQCREDQHGAIVAE